MNFNELQSLNLDYHHSNHSTNFNGIVNHYLNTSGGLPIDFDWIAYRSLNSDLSHITCYKDAVKHYKNHGFRQSRPYQFTLVETPEKNNLSGLEPSLSETLPSDFDWLAYKSMNSDLRHINSLQDAAKHYRDHGKRQERPYKLEEKKSQKQTINVDSSLINLPQLNPTQLKDFRDGTYSYLNYNNSVPLDFDWITYKILNSDLKQIKCYQDAIKHYKNYGIAESRPYKSNDTSIKKTIETDHEIKTQTPLKYNNQISIHTDDKLTHLDHSSENINQIGGDPHDPLFSNCVSIDLIKRGLQLIDDESQNQRNKKITINQLSNVKDQNSVIKKYNEVNKIEKKLGDNINHVINPNQSYSDLTTKLTNLKEENEINQPMEQSLQINENKPKNVPLDFNWLAYRSLNYDLKYIGSLQEAKKHYLEHGWRQYRPYKYENTQQHIQSIKIQPAKISPPKIQLTKIQPLKTSLDDQQIKLNDTNEKQLKLIDTNEKQIKLNDTNEKQIKPDDTNKKHMQLDHVNEKQILLDNTNNRQIKKDDINERQLQVHKTNEKQIQLENSNEKETQLENSNEKETQLDNVNKKQIQFNNVTKKQIQPNDQLPTNFNWLEYKSLHHDLKYINNHYQAAKHYMEHGQREGRVYKVTNPNKPVNNNQIIRPKPQTEKLKVIEIHTNNPVPTPNMNHVSQQNQLNHLNQKQPIGNRLIPSSNINLVNNLMKKSNKIISTNKPSNSLIPNIIHFVYGFKNQTEEFELFKYIAIKSAIEVNKPEKVYFYYKYQPFGQWWDLIKPLLILESVEPPIEIFGNKVRHFAHQSDIIRLRILNERGGIYFDIDTICLKPLSEFLKYDFVMGIQGNNYGLCNAIIMAKPNTEFGKQWYDSYRNFNSSIWDYHSVILPQKLSKTIPITILAHDALFYPLWDPVTKLLLNSELNQSECQKILKNSYCIHLWESWSLSKLKEINEISIIKYNSLYNIIARKFIRNNFSIVLITANSSDQTIKCIENLKSISNRSDINEILIFDNCSSEPSLIQYLKNIQNVNKFKVTLAPNKLQVPKIKALLFDQVQSDLIFSFDINYQFINESIFNRLKDCFNDESVGIIIPSPNYFDQSKNNIENSNSEVSNENINIFENNVCIFKNDLKYLQIKFNEYSAPSDASNLCTKIRNLGKNILLI